ncbi:MAG TPA: FadR/GntR family transcriptional regulator [Trueperaceae bacterium]
MSTETWEKLKPLNAVPLHRMILDQLHVLMSEGRMQPGDLLPPERYLAERLNVSRGTLREALRILEHEGVIVTRAGGGRRLRQLDSLEFATSPEEYVNQLRTAAAVDLMEARQALEERIVELACERATAEDLKSIHEALHGPEAFSAEEGAGDKAFHLAIAAATHNFVFVRMMSLHVDLVQGIRQKLLTEERKKEMFEEHEAIYRAIAARDPAEARAAMIRHRQRVVQLLTGVQ